MKTQQQWVKGDVFLIPLQDGSSVVGQVVGQERQVLNSASCAFFEWRVRSSSEIDTIKELPQEKMFSCLFVTRDLLDAGTWIVVTHLSIRIPSHLMPYENLRRGGYIGAKVTGSGNATKFLNAFYALLPWDQMKDPNYFDKFLIAPEKKPQKLVFKAS